MSSRYSSDQDRWVPCPHGAYNLLKIIRIRTNTNLKSKIKAVYNAISRGGIKKHNKSRGGRKRMKGLRRTVETRRTRSESPAGLLGVGREG